jgi:hypothetical protein
VSDEPIHNYFGLTYATHLVLDPARLNRMTDGQQRELTGMIDLLYRAFPDFSTCDVEALALAAEEGEYGDLNEEEMRLLDVEQGDDDSEHFYDWRGDEHGAHERVMVPSETEQQAREADRSVISRTLLQSMPVAWQQRFVELLEAYDEIDIATPACYDIRFYTAAGERTTDPVPSYNRGRTRLEPAVLS